MSIGALYHRNLCCKFPQDHVAATRLELEADIEYLMVEGAVQIYRVTADDVWMRNALPRLEKGIEYLTSDSTRWDLEHGLVKRPFTIDTWDFAYGQSSGNRRIEANTPCRLCMAITLACIRPCRQLAWLRRKNGDEAKAQMWEARAEMLRANMMRYLWNGTFFVHQLHLGHNGADREGKPAVVLVQYL